MFIIRDVSFAVFHFNQKVVVVIRLSNILSRQRLQVLTKRFIDYQSLLLCLKCFLEFQFQLLLFIHHFFLLLSVFLLFILIHLSQSHNHSNSNNPRFAYLQSNTLME